VSKVKNLMLAETVEAEVLPPQQSPLVPIEQFMAQIVARKNEIAERIDQLTENINGLQDKRGRMIAEAQLELGRMLLEARRRVESDEVGDEAAIDWWQYFSDYAPDISRSHAERWMAIAAKADPKAAAIAYRARAAGYQRSYYERQKQLTTNLPSQPEMEVEPATPSVEMEAEPEPDEDDQVQWDHSEPEPEPKYAPLPPPPKLARDPLAEAAKLKVEIIALMKLMRPLERE
jgi:hypothetical protein